MDDRSLDTEEFEQIPWSSLMAEQPAGVDRRVYVVLGVVGVVVALFFASRLLGGGTQPQPAVQGPVEEVVDVPTPAPSQPSPGVVVSEADLMADRPEVVGGDAEWKVVALAEWFVTDYFTTDGSPETERSLDSFGETVSNAGPTSVARPEPGMYVEWARAIAVSGDDDVGRRIVDVIFRTISLSGDGITRDPVAAVSVEVVTAGQTAGVSGPPLTIPVPDLGASLSNGPQPVDDGLVGVP